MPANDRPGKRPFWMHQIVEYILGIGLIAQGLQVPDASEAAVPSACGVLVLANAAIVRDGPFSAFRWVSRTTHRLLDLLVIAVIVVLALQPVVPVDAGARVIMIAIALVLGFVWWQSSFAERARSSASVSTSASASPSARGGSSGSAGTGADAPAPAADRSTEIGRRAGRFVGDGIRAGRRVAAKRRDPDGR